MDLTDLFRRYWPDTLRFSLYLCANKTDAQDLAAEAFLRAITSLHPIRAPTVRAYLLTIVRNLYRDRLRKAPAPHNLPDSLHQRGPGPSTLAEHHDDLDHVLAAMQHLPEPDRAILGMAAFADMPHQQIAESLDISVTAVKVRIHRARMRLNLILDPPRPRTTP